MQKTTSPGQVMGILGRNGSGQSLLGMAGTTPKLDNYSPNTFLIGGNNNNGGGISSNASNGTISGLLNAGSG